MYNTLLTLSRDIFFYKELKLPDTFQTRIYLMFVHFSVMLISLKKKNLKFNQKSYDELFFTIENNLRELGFGDIAVNKKMKELNKILYDILLKLEVINHNNKNFEINHNLLLKYFAKLNDQKNEEFLEFKSYFTDFYNFCFELPLDNMLSKAINFKI